ncbi:MAG: alpha/beta fold hydrolase [Acidimicrobiaceae bacterium]|nr:alpha/beta fold hydrolase [Acidimicrobiaceae bacterium]
MQVQHLGRTVRYANGGSPGDPGDPGVVLLHGSGMDRTVWQLQTRFLAHHGYRVAALDLPGHGGSDGPPLGSIEQMADWVAEMVAVLGLGPAHLVGHSMGTYIALEAARRHPEAVRSLVLLGTAAAMPVHPALLESAEHDVAHAGGLMTSWGYSSRAHIGHHASPGFWLLGGSRALIEASPDGVLAADMAACDSYGGAVDAAASATCPVSVVLGSDDKMTPVRSAQKLLAAFAPPEPVPAVDVTVLDGVGHMIPLEDPGRARACIAQALATADASFAPDDRD